MHPILLSTPGRCGTHWLARLLRKALPLTQEKTRRWNEPEMVAVMEAPAPDTLYLTHDPLAYFVPMLEHVTPVTIVRDPRDVTVSAAHYWISKMDDGAALGTLRVYWEAGIPDGADFDTVLDTLKHTLHNARWWDYWLRFRDVLYPPCYVVRYEDLYADPAGELRLLLDWLGQDDVPDAQVSKAVAQASFVKVSGGRAPGDEDLRAFYRKGVVGDWRNYFTPQENTDFCQRHRRVMEAFGYLQTS